MRIVTDAEAAKLRDYPATIAEERLLDTREALLEALEDCTGVLDADPYPGVRETANRSRALINQARGLPDSSSGEE